MQIETTPQTIELVLNQEVSKNLLSQNKTRDAALSEVWLYMEKYWKLKDETPEYFLLTKKNDTLNGHLWIAFFLGWWLLFIPNLVYYLAMQKRKKIFK